MSCPVAANPRETSTPGGASPPRVRLPKLVHGAGFAFFRRTAMRRWVERHGHIFEINVPLFGRSVIVSDPALVRSSRRIRGGANPGVSAVAAILDQAHHAGSAWLPFGGGARRCLGSDFAFAEMDVVPRTVLQNFRIQTDAAHDEKSQFRGIANTPKLGARAVVNRRM